MKKQLAQYMIVVLFGFILGGCFFPGQGGDSSVLNDNTSGVTASTVASSATSDIAGIVEKAGPAVVYIEATQSGRQVSPRYYGWPIPQQQGETATGTGFIIDSHGYILTNQHVIDGAQSVQVKLQDQEEAISARVVGQDYESDLALLKIEASDLPTLSMGDSEATRPGDPVVAIGNPLGLDHTVTVGVVSAKERPITIEDRNYKNLIQTDAAINPGNSGGPLINMEGKVIAINTAVSTDAQGIGFAIPINEAKTIVEELINNGKISRPYIGISMIDLTKEAAGQLYVDADTIGVVITSVLADSPASTAGVRKLDVLVSIDGKPVESVTEAQDYIQSQKIGQTITLGLLREQTSLMLPVTLKEQPDNFHNLF